MFARMIRRVARNECVLLAANLDKREESMDKERVREDILYVKEQMDELLIRKTKEAYDALGQMLQMDYVRGLSELDTELSIMNTMYKIYRLEESEKVVQPLLLLADDVKGAVELYYGFLFGLERIWFELEEEYQTAWISQEKEKGITPYAVYMILQHSDISEKEEVWNGFCKLWEKGNE